MKTKKYTRMTAGELGDATREFDRPDYEPKFKKPPRRLQQRHDAVLKKARQDRGRPPVGGGAHRIQVTMEKGLLARVDAYARQHGMTRSQLLAKGAAAIVAGAA
jgi:hypothetical protein